MAAPAPKSTVRALTPRFWIWVRLVCPPKAMVLATELTVAVRTRVPPGGLANWLKGLTLPAKVRLPALRLSVSVLVSVLVPPMVTSPAAMVRVPAAVAAKLSFGSKESAVALVRFSEPPARAMVPVPATTGAAPRLAAVAALTVPPMIETPPVKVLAPERVRVPVA